MKKNLKTACAKVTAVALALAMVASAAPANAAKAKKPALSTSKATITVGKTKKITVKKAKPKKTTWTVNKKGKKIVKLTKKKKTSVTIKALKKGSATVTAKIKVGKKNYTKKVKVTVEPKTTPTKSATPSKAPVSNAPASKAPVSNAPASNAPVSEAPVSEAPAYEPIKPVQPEKPSTPAKVLPELNLREEAATEWAVGGSYGTAIFNTDDTVDFSTEPWAANDKGTDKKKGSVYNNGIAWYLDPETKGQVDMSQYSEMKLTIKTDAEVCVVAWAGAAEASKYYDKGELWGGSKSTVENEDGSKTITYPVTKVFANAAKQKKAIAVGFSLKAFDGEDDSDEHYKKADAIVYGIEFVEGSEPQESAAPQESATPEEPTEPIATLDATGFKSFADLGITKDNDKEYESITVKIKAYDGTGALINSENENYRALTDYPKLTVGTEESCTKANGLGYGDGVGGNTPNYKKQWGMYYLNNLGKYGVDTDETGFFTITLGMMTYANEEEGTEGVIIPASSYDGFGFQNGSAKTSVSKIEIYEVTLNEKSAE